MMTQAMTVAAVPDPLLALRDCGTCGDRSFRRADDACTRCGAPGRVTWAYDTD